MRTINVRLDGKGLKATILLTKEEADMIAKKVFNNYQNKKMEVMNNKISGIVKREHMEGTIRFIDEVDVKEASIVQEVDNRLKAGL
jgi:hypothetical protein